MKIAIVCGHFMPDVGYVEVQVARAFSKASHEVRVFTSDTIPQSIKKAKSFDRESFKAGLHTDQKYGYTVQRFPAVLSMGAMVVCKGVNDSVREFDPGLIIIFGPGKLFPSPVLNAANAAKYTIFIMLGDDVTFQDEFTVDRTADYFYYAFYKMKVFLLRRLLKNPVYQKGVKFADHIIAYTPETPEIISTYIPKSLHATLSKKVIPGSLGFDPEKFFFDENERRAIREKLQIPDETPVLITCTRVIPFKRLERLIDTVEKVNSRGIALHCIIIGLYQDSYAESLKAHAAKTRHTDKLHLLPFMPHEEARKHYNASDIAYYWPSHVISTFEAMGTGLPVLLPRVKNTAHMLKVGINGWYFENGELEKAMVSAHETILEKRADYLHYRKGIERENAACFSFDVIARKLIDQAATNQKTAHPSS